MASGDGVVTRAARPAIEDCDGIRALFDALFADAENTRLLSGGNEPLYLPADADCPHHRVIFRHDYAASAMHEIAHWCVAGRERRRLVDYGYWYTPDGRNAAQQHAFERVEACPQALEWIFSDACGLRFRPSIDNLHGEVGDTTRFAAAIVAAARGYCRDGLEPRAARFRDALARRYGGPAALCEDDFVLHRLLS